MAARGRPVRGTAPARRRGGEAAGERIPEHEAIEELSPEESRLMLHELRVHQVELETQNEELRSTQAELEIARARNFDLYDLAPVAFCTLSNQGLIQQANLTAATLLGVPRGALPKQLLARFILKEDQDIFYLHRKRLLDSGEAQSCELRMTKGDGEVIWVQLETVAAKDAGGKAVFRVALIDITIRKRQQIQSELERGALEFLAGGRPLPESLAHLLLSYEAQYPGMRGSVMLLDPERRRLRQEAGPSLPQSFRQATDGMEIGPGAGSFTTTVHTGKTLVVADISRDPLWREIKDLALRNGLQACWSAPIFGTRGQALGVFIFYFNAPRDASMADLAAMERGAHLASLAIESRAPGRGDGGREA